MSALAWLGFLFLAALSALGVMSVLTATLKGLDFWLNAALALALCLATIGVWQVLP